MRRSSTGTMLLITGLALGACSAAEGEEQVAHSPRASDQAAVALPAVPSMPAEDFANQAAAISLFEIEAARIALQRTRSSEVKEYAQAMLDDNLALMAKLDLAADAVSPRMRPVKELPADMVVVIDALKSEPEQGFDSAYIRSQIASHEAGFTAMRNFALGGNVASLVNFARKNAAGVSDNLADAKLLNRLPS